MIENLKKTIGFEGDNQGINMPNSKLTAPAEVYTIKGFAYGHGDDNPLCTDPDYAKNTKYGCLIAAPSFISHI